MLVVSDAYLIPVFDDLWRGIFFFCCAVVRGNGGGGGILTSCKFVPSVIRTDLPGGS